MRARIIEVKLALMSDRVVTFHYGASRTATDAERSNMRKVNVVCGQKDHLLPMPFYWNIVSSAVNDNSDNLSAITDADHCHEIAVLARQTWHKKLVLLEGE